VQPFTCIHDAVATWPETATAVAVRSTPDGIDVCDPNRPAHGVPARRRRRSQPLGERVPEGEFVGL
jgi:hypothetical protein